LWRPGIPRVEWGELRLQGASEAWRTRVIVVRLDPRRVDLSLVVAFTRNEDWTAAALGLGGEREPRDLAPEYAPLAGAVVIDASGAVRIVAPDSVILERERSTAREAFHSYPMLLQDGVIPTVLRAAGRGVDLAHRDARARPRYSD
jgi:hypothetical protein